MSIHACVHVLGLKTVRMLPKTWTILKSRNTSHPFISFLLICILICPHLHMIIHDFLSRYKQSISKPTSLNVLFSLYPHYSGLGPLPATKLTSLLLTLHLPPQIGSYFCTVNTEHLENVNQIMSVHADNPTMPPFHSEESPGLGPVTSPSHLSHTGHGHSKTHKACSCLGSPHRCFFLPEMLLLSNSLMPSLHFLQIFALVLTFSVLLPDLKYLPQSAKTPPLCLALFFFSSSSKALITFKDPI